MECQELNGKNGKDEKLEKGKKKPENTLSRILSGFLPLLDSNQRHCG
jgi:hypothetical protein